MAPILPIDILRGVIDLIYPPICHICERSLDGTHHEALCGACWRGMPRRRERRCRRCGSIDPLQRRDHGCTFCRRRSFPHRCFFTIGRYEGSLRDLVHRLKGGRGFPGAVHPLARLLEERLRRHAWPPDRAPELVVPIPASRRRRRRTGFNPAGLLARRLAGRIGLRCTEKGLSRRREAPPQTGLTGAQRRRNLSAVYRGSRSRVGGRRVLLVDDVCTTGTTVAVATRALLKAGAHSVDVAVAAVRS